MGIRPNAPQLNNSGGDKRDTTCSMCGHGIFHGQERVWSRRPLGLVHAACREGRDRQLAAVAEAVLAS